MKYNHPKPSHHRKEPLEVPINKRGEGQILAEVSHKMREFLKRRPGRKIIYKNKAQQFKDL